MEDLVESLTRGNVTEVKVVLASVVMALACYQLVLIAVGYGKLRPAFLAARPASAAHRAAGDAIAVLLAVVAADVPVLLRLRGRCDGARGGGQRAPPVLALKIAVIRRWHGLGRYLPVLGLTVFVLLAVTWASSAGSFLADR